MTTRFLIAGVLFMVSGCSSYYSEKKDSPCACDSMKHDSAGKK